MSALIVLPVREANLLRRRIRSVQALRKSFLRGRNAEAVHDLRVASRRLREVLDYLRLALPEAWYERLRDSSRKITKELGDLRESEVNLRILKNWFDENQLSQAAIELLVQSQSQRFKKSRGKAAKRLSRKSFTRYKDFLSRLKGSRSMPATLSEVLQVRSQEFVGFSWHGNMDDERLHDLRIRTKKFRYAVELYSHFNGITLGRFLRRVRNLQEVLGEIHDLAVFAAMVKELEQGWHSWGLHMIPGALKSIQESAIQQKLGLYPRVYPLYSAVIQNAPAQLPLIQAKEVSRAEISLVPSSVAAGQSV